MGFESILDLKSSLHKEGGRPPFFVDLNLNQVLDRMNADWGEPLNGLFYFPADQECEDYRRAIYGDVKRTEVYELLMHFIETMNVRKKVMGKRNLVRPLSQKTVWQVWEVFYYCTAFTQLHEGLAAQGVQSAGFLSLQEYLEAYLTADAFVNMWENCKKLKEELTSIRLVLTYENNQIVVSEGKTDRAYETYLAEHFEATNASMHSPFAGSEELTPLEQEVMKIYAKKNPALFKGLEEFYKKYEKYADELLLRFTDELPYYLSFRKFQGKMEEAGFAFCSPVTCGREEFSAEGLYDLALALVNSRSGKPVISNAFDYRAGEQFFVLTGPNQGGKTTFARSLGQLIYFSKMGFDVPAVSAKVPYFNYILTHFSVEESLETGRGKLKEELVRLSPMMDSVYENTFVIINELFTTAANYDACIMGKNVLEHFIGQNDMGIYVTHLRELTEAHPAVVSLRAALDENRIQSFKIIRSAADESACAMNQVNKYKLTYEQLKERLS